MDDRSSDDRPATAADAEAAVDATRRAGGYSTELLAGLEIPFDRDTAGSSPEALAEVPSAREIAARGPLGPVSRNAKRAMRRLIAWYVHPITVDQSRFNEAITGELRRLERRLERVETPWPAHPGLLGPADGGLTTARESMLARLRRNGPAGPILVIGARASDSVDGLARIEPAAGDPLGALGAASRGSLAGVYLASVLPRLAARELIETVALATSSLLPGGWLAADAPDPAHPRAPRDPSAIDLAMRRWLLPETVRFVFDAAGLGSTATLDLHMVDGTRAWYVGVGHLPGS